MRALTPEAGASYFLRTRGLIGLCGWLLIATQTWAQGTVGRSPLSRFGIGEHVETMYSRNFQLGNQGVAMPSIDFINMANPALLPYNRLSNLEIGLGGGQTRLADNQNTSTSKAGGPTHFALAFPIGKKATMSIGIQPQSVVSYDGEYQGPVANNDNSDLSQVEYRIKGDGNLSKVHLASGFNLGRGFSAGAEAYYSFGTLNNERRATFFPSSVYPELRIATSTQLNRFGLKPGVAFRRLVDTARNLYLGFGLTYDLGLSGQADLLEYYEERRESAFSTSITRADTTRRSSGGGWKNPGIWTAGVSIAKLNRWAIGVEYSRADWSQLSLFDVNQGLKLSQRFSLGGEWTPNSSTTTRYINYITYRLGGYWQQTPYEVNGATYTDRAVTAGFTLPILRKDARFTRPFINIGLAVGRRGDLGTNQFEENYWRVSLGVTLNDTQWFRRFKHE